MKNRQEHDPDADDRKENLQSKRRRSLFIKKKDNKKLPKFCRQINHESVTLVWFDKELGKQNRNFVDDMKITEAMLRRLNDFVFLCSKETDCINQIERSKDKRVLLIIAGACATKSFLEKAHSFRQVDSILVFCTKFHKYEVLLHDVNNSKIKGIYTDQDSLERCIVRTTRAIEKQLVAFALYDSRKLTSTHNLDRECGSFVWRQLMKEAVKKIVRNNILEEDASKQEMLQKCREYYRDNTRELKNINEFEQNYTRSQAMWWYTRNTFLFRLVNKALLTEDIEALYTYRFYIADLSTCIEEDSKRLRENSKDTRFKVYRGKKQSPEEIQSLQDSIGQVVSPNGFLSASRNRNVAEMFADVGSVQTATSDLSSIIYEIEIDLKEPYVILADLQQYSYFKDEEEILFDLASVFEIKSMIFDKNTKTWICCMTASNKGTEIAKEYIKMKQTSLSNGDVTILLGDLLFDMGEFTKSKIYFDNLNNRIGQNVNVLFGLGRACFDLHTEYEQALEHFNMVLNICENQDPINREMTAKVYDYIGRVHRHQCRHTQALDNFHKAAKQYELAGPLDRIPYAQMLSGLGFVRYQLGMDDVALENFQEALQIIQKNMPFDNPDLSTAFMNLSLPLYHMGQYDKALESVELALHIGRAVLPGKSLQIALILNYIGKYLYKKDNYDQALTKLVESQEIYRYFYPDEKSPYFAVRYNNIGKVYYRQKIYKAADEQYDKALANLQPLKFNHVNTAYTWKNKGELYLAIGDYNNSSDSISHARN